MSNRKMRSGAGSASARNRKHQGKGRRTGAILPRSFGAGDDIVKRMTIPNGIIAIAANVVAVQTLDDTLVQSNPATEWASFAARYQQYRVRAMHVHFKSVYPCNTATNEISTMYYSDFIGTALPTTVAQVLADERCFIKSSSQDHTMTVTWARNPNAKLWNPTSAVIPAANSYGVALCSTTAALFSGADASTYTIVFEVEFRGSQ